MRVSFLVYRAFVKLFVSGIGEIRALAMEAKGKRKQNENDYAFEEMIDLALALLTSLKK